MQRVGYFFEILNIEKLKVIQVYKRIKTRGKVKEIMNSVVLKHGVMTRVNWLGIKSELKLN